MGAASTSVGTSTSNRLSTDSSQCQTVTILQQDGNVLEFSRRLRCCQLLAAYPGHTVYKTSGPVREEEGRILQRDSFLELGQVYFLLPQHTSDSSSLPFLISRDYMAKILAARKARLPQNLRRSEIPVRKPRTSPAMRRARSGNWVSSLSSIPEVAAV